MTCIRLNSGSLWSLSGLESEFLPSSPYYVDHLENRFASITLNELIVLAALLYDGLQEASCFRASGSHQQGSFRQTPIS